MEPKFNTSFIPKKSLKADIVGGTRGGGGSYVKRRTVRGPGFFLMLLVFIVSVSASIGMFVLIKSVESNIQTKTKTLNSQKDLFNSDDIDMLVKAQVHLDSAKKLLKNHVAVTELFNLLEDITLKSVQYTKLEYEDSGDDIVATITGTTKGFKEVALQTAEYRNKKNASGGLRSPVLKELERDSENKTVDFTVDVSVDRFFVSFSEAVKDKPQHNLQDLQTNAGTEMQIENTEASTTDIIESNL